MKASLTLLLVLLSYVSAVQFFFVIPPNKRQCLGEYLSENTLVIFSLSTEEKEITATLFDPNGYTVYMKENSTRMKISFTASDAGHHQLCIDNETSSGTKINFEFLTGVEAKDYSEIAKKSNLKPVELNLKKLEDTITFLIKELSGVMIYEETNLAVNDALSNKIILFSMITLISMIVVGFFETVFIKKYLQKRKLI